MILCAMTYEEKDIRIRSRIRRIAAGSLVNNAICSDLIPRRPPSPECRSHQDVIYYINVLIILDAEFFVQGVLIENNFYGIETQCLLILFLNGSKGHLLDQKV